MATYRDALPQLGQDVFFTDGGLETTLIFHDKLELPHFASFVLLDNEDGIVNAAVARGLPSVISFATETDGRLPSGQVLRAAIEQVDATTDGAAAYFMVNCAHTEHFDTALRTDEAWTTRIRGVRANASRMSHAELDEAEKLDDGDPIEFGQLYRALHERFSHISVLGGCCGTDHRHINEVRSLICPATK